MRVGDIIKFTTLSYEPSKVEFKPITHFGVISESGASSESGAYVIIKFDLLGTIKVNQQEIQQRKITLATAAEVAKLRKSGEIEKIKELCNK